MPTKRAGVTVGVTNPKEHMWGFWDFPAVTDNGFVGRAAFLMDRLEGLAAPLHDQNRHRIERRSGALPEVEVRIRNARSGQRELAKVKDAIDKLERDTVVYRYGLRPYEYRADVSQPSDSFAARTELRSALRGMNDGDRRRALADVAFRKALLELPAAASGVGQADYNMIRTLELEQKFPEELMIAADGERAVEALRISMSASQALIESELAELGQTPIESEPVTFRSTFPQPRGNGHDNSQGEQKTAAEQFASAVAELEARRSGH